MTASVGTASIVSDSTLLAPRWARILRASVLLALGLAILFSATLHGNAAFDVAIASSGLAVMGVVHLIEWTQRRGQGGANIALLLGIVAIVFAVLVIAVRAPLALPVGIAAWALVSALLEFVGMVVSPGTRQDAPIIGAVGILLSIVVLLSRDDVVAVIGFFGGYAIVAGVFLGIAAFDTRRVRDAMSNPTTQTPAAIVESE